MDSFPFDKEENEIPNESEYPNNELLESSSECSSGDDESSDSCCDQSSNISIDGSEDMINELTDNSLTIGEIFRNKLQQWALKFQVSLIALTALLMLLQPIVNFPLPLDARTLMGTLRQVHISQISNGEYYHFGLRRAIQSIFREYKRTGKPIKEVRLMFNIDGLPIFKSTKKHLWLILCSEVDAQGVYPVGAYYGLDKPDDANEFMQQVVQELIELSENGIEGEIEVEGENIKVSCSSLICDAPAKSFVLYLKGHTGYNSCSKCLITGEYVKPKETKGKKKKKGNVCFPGSGPFQMKTDEGFLRNDYNEFDTGNETIFKRVPGFGCISSVPLDYMHLVLLGVMKKLIRLWLLGPLKTRLNSKKVHKISKKLLRLRHSVPKEFGRKPRTIFEFRHWKATEFRTFLLYTGPIALKDILPIEQYENFILLHSAIRILCSKIHIEDSKNIDCAHEMLERFVLDFQDIYGKKFVSHNVHNLLHLCSDVKKYGTLDQFSSFRFENYLSILKRMIRKGDKPLEQIARRYSETEAAEKNSGIKEQLLCQRPHNSGPLIEICKNVWQQYKIVKLESFTIDCDADKNRYVLLNDGTFDKVLNIIKCNEDDIQLIITKINSIDKLYNNPDSRCLNIHIGNGMNNSIFSTSVKNLLCKVWRVPTKRGFILLPLLH